MSVDRIPPQPSTGCSVRCLPMRRCVRPERSSRAGVWIDPHALTTTFAFTRSLRRKERKDLILTTAYNTQQTMNTYFVFEAEEGSLTYAITPVACKRGASPVNVTFSTKQLGITKRRPRVSQSASPLSLSLCLFSCARISGSSRADHDDCFASCEHPCVQWPQSTQFFTLRGIFCGLKPHFSADFEK